MDKLLKARETINETDREMAALFEKRMKAVRSVAEYKKEKGLPVFDRERERQLIDDNLSNISDEKIKEFYLSFLRCTIDISKEYQQMIIDD